MLVEVVDSLGKHMLPAMADIVRVVLGSRPHRVQGATEVRDGSWAIVFGPLLGPQRLRHRRPGIEGRNIATGGYARAGPPQHPLVRLQPQLECLGGTAP